MKKMSPETIGSGIVLAVLALAGWLGFRWLGVPGLAPRLGAWEDYAPGSGKPEAGTSLPSSILSAIKSARAEVPVEPKLVKSGVGHFYMGSPDIKANVDAYLDGKAAQASGETKRGILAFKALQGREGSTAAINSYDNQILTWGTGWSGLGGLPRVMDVLSKDPTVKARLSACGVRYDGDKTWSVVDLKSGKVVTGTKPALEVMRASLPILYLLIDLARSPATRDAVADAQLEAFLATSGSIQGSDAIQTQALYTFLAHLQHWAPGYAKGALSEAGSAGDDCARAESATRTFYRKAKASGGWVPSWKQFQGYVRDMAHDGLDCTGTPIFQADNPPTDSTATT